MDHILLTQLYVGLTVLFDKLQQGCVENDEVLALAAARAEAEEFYGNRLKDIPAMYTPKKNGFGRDDGASLKKAYEGIAHEMGEEGRNHVQVAENIRRMVLVPFGKWADEHRQRVDFSSSTLKGKIKSYDKLLNEVHKSQKRYFNKCRVLEDFKESDAGAESAAAQAAAAQASEKVALADTPEADRSVKDKPVSSSTAALFEPIELADEEYTEEDAKNLFVAMLEQIPQTSIRVPILGTYGHVSSGDNIVRWFQEYDSKKNGDAGTSLASAEKFGQDLINEGFLRLVGQVGNKFANSSVMHYQWRRQAYEIANKSNELEPRNINLTPLVGEYIGETIQSYINNPHPDETPEQRLKREVAELDERYKDAVQSLDDSRCSLEEAIIDHLKFMERCEADRLKAIKSVFLDFAAAVSNVVPAIQSSVDKVLLFQETIHPVNDLRYVLESYQTGSFTPKVTIYDNYYNSAEDQTFGVDLELRCRGDRKRVPIIVSAILSHMDQRYPEMENDEVRLGTWTVSVPLKSSHELRRRINTAKSFDRSILSEYDSPVIVSVLKLYLLELPDSVIPSNLYDIIKTIYSQHGNEGQQTNRINAIQNTFSQMRLSNIATLDALSAHLNRLISIANAPQEYQSQLAQELSYCILRPRVQSALTIGDRHAYRLVLDLFQHWDMIFTELKRNNSGARSGIASPVRSKRGSLNKSSQSPPSSADVSRRPTLQNRMEALSMKLRKDSRASQQQPATLQEDESEVSKAPDTDTPGSTPSAERPASPASFQSAQSFNSQSSRQLTTTSTGNESEPIEID